MSKYIASLFINGIIFYRFEYLVGGIIVFALGIVTYYTFLKTNEIHILDFRKSHSIPIFILAAYGLYICMARHIYPSGRIMEDSLSYKIFTLVIFLVFLIELLVALKKSIKEYKIKKSYDNLITPIAISIVFVYLLYKMITKIYYFFYDTSILF